MSLMVYLISKDKSIDINEIEKQIPQQYNDLFGAEACRKTLWGKEIMKELGCHMIYSLREKDIYAFGKDLQELKRELDVILSNIYIFEDKSIDDYSYVELRVQNALEAIKVAEKYKDVGVYIG